MTYFYCMWFDILCDDFIVTLNDVSYYLLRNVYREKAY